MGREGNVTDFPIGHAIADRWTIRDPLCGGPDRGMYRAIGTTTVLVTMGPPQRLSSDELAARFALRCDGIVPLQGISSIEGEGARYDVLVEDEPEGAPLTAGPLRDARAIGRDLARIVAAAHDQGVVLGAVRPELVYTDGTRCTGIAPRAEPFLALATERSYGVPPCFEHVYFSPEALSLRPATPASDVFSLCATLFYILTGEPPFAGETIMERMSSALRARVRRASVDLIVRAGLVVNAAERPQAREIHEALG